MSIVRVTVYGTGVITRSVEPRVRVSIFDIYAFCLGSSDELAVRRSVQLSAHPCGLCFLAVDAHPASFMLRPAPAAQRVSVNGQAAKYSSGGQIQNILGTDLT